MGKMGVYEIRNNITGKIYIGSSCNIKSRIKGHINSLKNKKHSNRYLQFSWNKHGEQCFEFRILVVVNNRDELLDIEQLWLDKTKCYDRDKGYNIARFTDTNMRRMSEQDILKIANLHKENVHYKQIAKQVGVSVGTVHEIRNGNLYSDITKLPKTEYEISNLSHEDVLYIARTCKQALKRDMQLSSIIGKLADTFNTTNDAIYSISSGKTWGDLTGIKYVPQRKIKNATEILSLYKDMLKGLDVDFLAYKHNVTKRFIQRVGRGEIHSNTTGVEYKRKRLTNQEVVNIYTRKLNGQKTIDLANEFNVSGATIDRIASRAIWKEVTSGIV